MDDKRIGLYVHIPYCRQKCSYCDFNSYASMEGTVPEYFNALNNEISSYSDMLQGFTVKTVFMGGGTPSYVDSKYIHQLMSSLNRHMNIEGDAEISIETNPGTLTEKKLSVYREAGINRLSIGLQAWQNSLLKYLGRINNIEDFITNYKLALKAGFNNINVDLIFGIPGQSIKDWTDTIDNISQLDITHLSCYSLKIEEGTPFGLQLEKGKLKAVEDELDREMYWLAIEKLRNNGFKQYEISNFAREGYECRHNLVYWNAEEYVGFGAGAHSYFNKKRFNNVGDIHRYSSLINNNESTIENVQAIDEQDSMSEYMILRLRLVEGVLSKDFEQRFGVALSTKYSKQIERLVSSGLADFNGNKLRLTQKGLDLANQAFVEFI